MSVTRRLIGMTIFSLIAGTGAGASGAGVSGAFRGVAGGAARTSVVVRFWARTLGVRRCGGLGILPHLAQPARWIFPMTALRVTP